MNICILNSSLIEKGRQSYRAAILQYLGNSEYGRSGGPEYVPGSVVAIIESGIVDEDELVSVAAKVTRCKKSTVLEILENLSGTDDLLWSKNRMGRYYLGRSASDIRASHIQ